MYQGWGLVTLAITGLFMVFGTYIILRMVKIEV